MNKKCGLFQENHKLQVSENKVFKKIFGPKTDEVSEQFRILKNENTHSL
jgi:hypothetical protein